MFLLADINIEVVLEMLLLNFSNADIKFSLKKPTKSFYSATKVIATTKQVKIINWKKFAIIALD